MIRRERLAAARLYVLVTSSLCRLPVAETVRRAVAGGADVIQLREKTLPSPATIRIAEEIGPIARAGGALFLVNDRLDVAAAVECDGVHVGQEDAPVAAVRAALPPGALVGLSTHSLPQVRAARAACPDYLGFGPVFGTATKDAGRPRGPAAAARATAVAGRMPVFAIGGIDVEKAALLALLGATRIAVSSAVLSAEDPEAAARALRAEITRPAADPRGRRTPLR